MTNSLWAGLSWPFLISVYLGIFHLDHDKHEAFTALHNVTGSSLILRLKLPAQCSWRGMRLLEKAVQAVNVRNFSLDASVLSTPSPKTEHLLPLSCLCSQIFVLVLKKIPNIKLYNKSLHSSTGNSKCHSTHTLLLQQSYCQCWK